MTLIHTFGKTWLAVTVIVILGSCSSRQPAQTEEFAKGVTVPPYAGLHGVDEWVPADRVNSLPRKLAEDGIQALSVGDLEQANNYFNQALMLQPADSYLQWLNGVAYHLQAMQGDSSKYPMAREAYSLSVKFDRSNWMAHNQLGLLFMDINDNRSAQTAFAEALLFRPNDPDLLYEMLLVSYYNQDPETAAAALGRLRRLEPDSERTIRATPLVMAALGEQARAQTALARYQSTGKDFRGSEKIGQRVQDWNDFYDYHTPAVLTAAAAQSDSQNQPQNLPENKLADTAYPFDPDAQMVIVDVAIIQSEEDLGTRKGINLLSGLRVQYGLDRITTDRRTVTSSNSGNGPSDSLLDSFSRTLTKAISIPQLEYSLNIFNSAIFKNEVLARPTLVALNGEESRFFAGSNVQAAATASSTIGAVSGGQAVKLNEDIGVDMKITPTLRDDGRVKIEVEVTRTFLETPDSAIDYEFKIQTAKTHVRASVVMSFGETLILSGLSEKESETFRDGVPFLQDIPILQYFFSEERTLDFQRSVLVLITPRNPVTLTSGAQARPGDLATNENAPMIQFQNRFSSWFKPAPHWVSVVQHLEKAGLYREFRTGDLELQIWSESQAFRKRFGEVMEFLYY